MPSPARIIIDTDPGVDDVLAMLLALAAKPEDIEVLLISVTYGNVDVQNCLRNVVSMFHVIEQEIQWRKNSGLAQGFEQFRISKPIVAIGADGPLGDQRRMADYFHGTDGLGGIHDTHQHLTPPETWKRLFSKPPPNNLLLRCRPDKPDGDVTSTANSTRDNVHGLAESSFTPSQRPSHLEILRILEENPPDTIDIIAIGPLTNLALAASHSPMVLMRAKSVLVMGGAVNVPGNITPLAEFNTYADATAAARLYALTSPNPASTLPPSPPVSSDDSAIDRNLSASLPPYPPKAELGEKRLNIILFPLDITTPHVIRRDEFRAKTQPLIAKGSPLGEWVDAFLSSTFRKMETLHHGHEGESASISLHDPMCVWYALTGQKQSNEWSIAHDEDLRVESAGQWTRGSCIVDRRSRKMEDDDDGEGDEKPSDNGGWLSRARGNRLSRCKGTPGEDMLATLMLDTIFG